MTSSAASCDDIRVAIAGCTGRMGRRLCALVAPPLRLVAAFASAQSPFLGRPLSELDPVLPSSIVVSLLQLDRLLEMPQVIVDFSSPQATVEIVKQAAAAGIAVVIGTTGLTKEQEACIESATSAIALVHAMNYSLGMNVLAKLVRDAAKALGNDFNIEIIEAHHNKKVDAPSGSALALADSVCVGLDDGRSRSDLVHGRVGIVGQRTQKEIGMHSMRIGSVVGDHTVFFGSEFERLELTHRAQNRDVFAAGALKTALWLFKRRPGKYAMEDVLFGSADNDDNIE